ncbi:phage SPP1 structural protein [Lysinibacillus sphaericus]|uniref:Phage SPP1 structural protein n=1 Tax=Lysinibacillus sphaericus OT4b.31 TaxID=1285586 RepID=R7ZDM9_LYSSH|nr:phage SPP1 structural protein [Lysinibacillus sphaericus]EON72255.1 phage SPP1 structural protein [Lysinibacillus sphaericus OT4b.31]
MNGNFSARIGARITEFMARMRQVQNTIRTTANDVRVDIGADVSEFNRRMAMIRARIAALVRERVVIKIEARIKEFQNSINRIATNIRAFGELAQHTIQGALIALLPAVVPLISNIGVAIANLGPMIGTVAGSTFALVGAFAAAGAAAVAFGAVAIPTIKDLFTETGPPFTALQKKAWNSFESVKKTYQSLVKETEKPVLEAFTSAMQATNTILNKLRPLFLSSAQAVANLMKQLNTAIGTPPVQKFLEYLNTTGAPMLETFGRSFGNVFKGLGSMLVAFAPLSASTAKGFEEMTARFAEWANGLSGSAKFQAFMDYVSTNMPKVRAIFRDAIAGVVYFFSAFASSSSGMMDGLVDMMARFKEWSASLSQNQGFQQFLSYVSQSAPSVMKLIGNLVTFLVNLGIGMAPLGAAIVNIANKFLEFTNNMMENHRIIGILIAAFISFGGIMLAVLPNIIAFSKLFKGLGPSIIGGIGKAFKFIKPLFTNFSVTVGRIATTILPKLGAALGFIISPVGLIIAAIVSLIAIFVGLYKTNETFRNQVQIVWEAIKTGISVAVTAVKDLIMSVWTQITTFWNENQENIKSTASTIWNVIGTVVTTVMSAIGAIMQFVWPVVKALIVSTWNAIKNVIQGAIDVILGIIKTFSSLFQGDWQGVWDGIKQILSGALQLVWGVVNLYFVGKLLGPLKSFGSSAKSILQSVWTAIKGIFTNTLNAIKTLVTNIFNGIKSTIQSVSNTIKSTISSVWNGIKSVITTVLNAIKSVVTTIWNGIKSVITSVLNKIRSTVSTVWNGIKSVISSVLNGIKSVVTSIWNAIKSVISSVLNGIKTIVSNMWNGIKTTVETAMNGVKTAIETGWNAAKSFLQNINLLQIGKDIINGLIKGITDSFGAVASALSSLTDKIPSWVKSALGIHSPSRVMIAIAKWIPIGVAKGIESTTNVVKNAVNAMTKKAIPDFSKNVSVTKEMMQQTQKVVSNSLKESNSEVLAIQKDYDAKRAELTKKSDAQIKEIKAKAADKGKKLTAAQQRQITKIQADEKANREKIAKDEAKAIEKIKSKSQKETFDALKDFADKQIGLEKWTTKQQAEYWQYAATAFKEGTDERIEAQINYNKAMSDLTKEKFDKEKDYIDRKKKYNQMSLTQELAAYNKYMKQYKVGSEERIFYEDKIAETKQAIHEKLTSLNDEYISKMKETQQKEIDGIKELEKAYEEAVNNRASSIYSFKNLFDEIGEKAQVTSQQMIKNLQDQVSVMSSWASDIHALAGKGIEKGLLAELQAMGPNAYAEIEALNNMTASELGQFNDLWKTKTALARSQAEAELVGLREDTNKQVEALKNDTKTQLESYKNEWLKQIKAIKTGTTGEFNAMTASMKQIGENVIQGLRNGMKSEIPAMLSEVKAMAAEIEKTTRKALGVKSPSRVMMAVGKWIPPGLAKGIDSSAKVVAKATNAMAASAIPDISSNLAATKAELKLAASDLTKMARADLSVLTDGLSVRSALSSAHNTNISSESVLDSSLFDTVIQLLQVIADKDLSLDLDGRAITNYVDEYSAKKADLKRSMKGR